MKAMMSFKSKTKSHRAQLNVQAPINKNETKNCISVVVIMDAHGCFFINAIHIALGRWRFLDSVQPFI